MQNELSWQADYPQLFGALVALSDAQTHALESEDSLLEFVSAYVPELELLKTPIATPTRHQWKAPEAATMGVPERKRAQIEGFVGALLGSEMALSNRNSVVDWCSGRGFLARAMHHATGSPVVCLERDTSLHRLDLTEAIRFLPQDVLEPLPASLLCDSQLHTALHACGDLHLSMLRQAAPARVPALACSPCCYHFTRERIYHGVSRAAQKSHLCPTRDELRLATAQTSTANTLDRTLRQRELLWRVAFDLHLRELRGIDLYSRTPSVRKSLLKTNFNTFALALVDQLARRGRQDFEFSPLSGLDEAKLMQRAQTKLSVLSRLEKAQLAFRLALERWLLLDRALYLQEHGYQVEIQKFCAKHQSGRNHVILARLPV